MSKNLKPQTQKSKDIVRKKSEENSAADFPHPGEISTPKSQSAPDSTDTESGQSEVTPTPAVAEEFMSPSQPLDEPPASATKGRARKKREKKSEAPPTAQRSDKPAPH
jgi:hypothetical protein